MQITKRELQQIIKEELQAVLDEKRKKKKRKKKKKKKKSKGKKDACYHKVKSRYKVWPSAYASGALVKCRKKGAKNWGNKSEGLEEEVKPDDLRDILDDEGGAAGLDPMVKGTKSTKKKVKDTLKDMDDVGKHKKGDYIKDDGKQIRVKK
mgnify:FL=1